MKKLQLLSILSLVGACAVATTACGDDDDEPDGMIRAGFSLAIPASAKWLTLVSTTEVGGNYADHGVWVDAQLTLIPGTGTIIILSAVADGESPSRVL